MRASLPACLAVLALAAPASAHGVLIPRERSVPPLAMVRHTVDVTVEDQVSTTRVEQVFRNHTDRPLEATYVFPVPRGASVNQFAMWVDGKEVGGEMVEAAKARQIYADIVRRTMDPGLLEYIGNDLLQVKVFPVPARGDQKLALRFTALSPREGNLVEYTYPAKTDGRANRALEEFTVRGVIRSKDAVKSVYSPTHAVSTSRSGDREVRFEFDRHQAAHDKDFQLFYSLGGGDFGLTLLTHRPLSGEPGYFMFLASPPSEPAKFDPVPRDVVLVLDTSGSMAGVKMEQGKRALKQILGGFHPRDRFAVLNFSTGVNSYRDRLADCTPERIEDAKRWVDGLHHSGGTAINDALQAALALRTNESGRTFTVIFFTDGMPTVGETNPERILRNVADKNTAGTRIFTFGVGDDVNASMLDRLADQTRAVSTYVRPSEDIESKASALYAKISHPVLTNLRLSVGDGVRFDDVYPTQLPDLFAGGQLVAFGRFTGQGSVAVRLSGTAGGSTREFVYETTFPTRSDVDRDFVEQLWARRKAGYLLDQIRANGEKKELVDEVVALAKRYGIATPYTSYLIVPDGPAPVSGPGRPRFGMVPGAAPAAPAPGLAEDRPEGKALRVIDYAKQNQAGAGGIAQNRSQYEDRRLDAADKGGWAEPAERDAVAKAKDQKKVLEQAQERLRKSEVSAVQGGKLGVDLSVASNTLREQQCLTPAAVRSAYGRNCLELGGVWIDEGYDAKMPAVVVKAQSAAYFRILDRQPKMKDVYRLGNHLVWVTPARQALVIDSNDGKEELSDAEIDGLFAAKK